MAVLKPTVWDGTKRKIDWRWGVGGGTPLPMPEKETRLRQINKECWDNRTTGQPQAEAEINASAIRTLNRSG